MNLDNYLTYNKTQYALKALEWLEKSPHQDILDFCIRTVGTLVLPDMHEEILDELEAMYKRALKGDLKSCDVKTRKRRRFSSRPTFLGRGIDPEKMEDEFKYLKNSLEEDKHNPQYYSGRLYEIFRFDRKLTEACLGIVKKYLNRKLKGNSKLHSKSSFYKNLSEIKDTFNLTESESSLLVLYYMVRTDSDMYDIWGRSDYDITDLKNIKYVSDLTGVPVTSLKRCLDKRSPLRAAVLIEKNMNRSSIDISTNILDFLNGASDKSMFDSFFDTRNEEHHVKAREILDTKTVSLLKTLIRSPGSTNILFHGRPGTGKTELAYALAKEAGIEIFKVSQKDDEDQESLSFRRTALIAAQNLLPEKNGVVLVDEADELISNTNPFSFFPAGEKGGDKKSWLNDFLESSKLKVIWITNHCVGVDDSTKRRFSYIEEFDDLNQGQRESVIGKQMDIKKTKLFNIEEVKEIARKYEVSAGTIALALEEAVRVKKKASEQKKVALEIIASHQKFIKGEKKELDFRHKTYDLSALNTDQDAMKVVENMKSFVKALAEVKDSNPEGIPTNMNLLFQGAPGTGKTEFAKYLARELGCELMLKRASDIKSPYVGVAEKNIAKMFQEAEKQGAILFLDEADSLIYPREAASRSWELSETNELLTQMENFKGILICATNFLDKLDSAAMRRFNLKIKFDYLNELGKKVLFEKMLVPLVKVETYLEFHSERLDGIQNLTPGDFKVVRQKNWFNQEINFEELLEGLELESSYKKVNKRISLTL